MLTLLHILRLKCFNLLYLNFSNKEKSKYFTYLFDHMKALFIFARQFDINKRQLQNNR